MKVTGDFRYRFELIDQDDKDEIRYRNRIRARLQIKGKVSDQIDIVIRLASGSSDPVSSNQTLDGGFTSKYLWLDKAYFDWRPIKQVKIKGGKMGNPFYKPANTQLIWDGDLTPEGLATQFKAGSGNFKFFGNAAYFWVEERKSDDDTHLIGLQFGGDLEVADGKVGLKFGGSYFTYTECAGWETFVDAEDSFGNSTDPDGKYLYDYDLMEVFVDMTVKLSALKLGFYGDYIKNTDPDDEDTAYLAGFSLSKKGTYGWKVNYNYRSVEKDATLGAFNDSDFAGGGTNGNGHKLSASINLPHTFTVGGTYLLNTIDPDGDDIGYDRFQFDLKYKF